MNGHDDPLRGVLLSSGDVAALMGVSRQSVTRWARQGRLPVDSRVLGGSHLRYQAREVLEVVAKLEPDKVPMTDIEFAMWLARRINARRRRRDG